MRGAKAPFKGGILNKEDLMVYYLKQIITNLKNNGIKDITTEICTFINNKNGQKLKVKFFTKSQWESIPSNKANAAQKIMKVDVDGFKSPDYTVTHDEVTYYVKVIK